MPTSKRTYVLCIQKRAYMVSRAGSDAYFVAGFKSEEEIAVLLVEVSAEAAINRLPLLFD